VGEFGEEADKAIALEHRISVGYFEASSTAIEAMQMHEQAERDVAAERAAAEGTEARARAQFQYRHRRKALQRSSGIWPRRDAFHHAAFRSSRLRKINRASSSGVVAVPLRTRK
jgi:hypothetical protein